MTTETKVTHTPAPWKAIRYRGDWVIEVYNRESGFGSTVAELKPEQSSLPAEEHEANAHVCAAAPDMLEALEQLVEQSHMALAYIEPSDKAGIVDKHQLAHAIGAARKAIAKAKGGAA